MEKNELVTRIVLAAISSGKNPMLAGKEVTTVEELVEWAARVGDVIGMYYPMIGDME